MSEYDRLEERGFIIKEVKKLLIPKLFKYKKRKRRLKRFLFVEGPNFLETIKPICFLKESL